MNTCAANVESAGYYEYSCQIGLDNTIHFRFGSTDTRPGSGSITLDNHLGDIHRIAIHDKSQVAFIRDDFKYVMSTVIIKPRDKLLSNSRYYVQFDPGILTDTSSGNSVMTAFDNPISFLTSADSSPPIPLSVWPAHNSVNVPLDLLIYATFNEPVRPFNEPNSTAQNVTLSNGQGDTRKVFISSFDNILQFRSQAMLLPNTQYHVIPDADPIADLSGNVFPWPKDQIAFSFKTGDDPNPPAFYLNDSPVAINVPITLVTANPIKAGVGAITLRNIQGDTRKIAITDPSQISFDTYHYSAYEVDQHIGGILKIKPTPPLIANSEYTIQIDPAAITNLSGVAWQLADNTRPLSVKTLDMDTRRPFVQEVGFYSSNRFKTPDSEGHWQNIDIDSQINLVFSEAIALGKGNITIDNGRGDRRSIAINDTRQVYRENGFDFVLYIVPSQKFIPGSQYMVKVDAGAITDLAGNAYVSGILTFDTALLGAAGKDPVVEINKGNSLGRYENNDILVFHFNTPVKSYYSFKLNRHTFGGNDIILSADGLSASVQLNAASNVAPGDILTLYKVTDRQGNSTDIDFTL